MNRFLLLFLAFGAVCLMALCDLPEEENFYRRWRPDRSDNAESTEFSRPPEWFR